MRRKFPQMEPAPADLLIAHWHPTTGLLYVTASIGTGLAAASSIWSWAEHLPTAVAVPILVVTTTSPQRRRARVRRQRRTSCR
ncbi:MAG: hypothetical protein QOE89_3781 [Pseudonocardiales bacterium]|nr:hypothetical protein [Pseudonocardiales bacterium]